MLQKHTARSGTHMFEPVLVGSRGFHCIFEWIKDSWLEKPLFSVVHSTNILALGLSIGTCIDVALLVTLHSTLLSLHFIPDHTLHPLQCTILHGLPRINMVTWENLYKIVQMPCFPKVFYVIAFGCVVCSLKLLY